jgi:hypothetical protein
VTARPDAPSRESCIAEAGRLLAIARAERDALTPRAAAEAAHGPGGPAIDELEDLIRAHRGLPPLDRAAAAAS